MLWKKTTEMNQVLNEINVLIKNSEKHIQRLLDSCVSFDQLGTLPQYCGQIYSNIRNISGIYKPTLWWRNMYRKEVEQKITLSHREMLTLIDEKYNKFSKI